MFVDGKSLGQVKKLKEVFDNFFENYLSFTGGSWEEEGAETWALLLRRQTAHRQDSGGECLGQVSSIFHLTPDT